MECLHNALKERGVGRLFWCGFQDAEPHPKVAALIAAARQAGRQAFYVAGNGFDDTLRRLSLQCLDGDIGERAKALFGRERGRQAPTITNLSPCWLESWQA